MRWVAFGACAILAAACQKKPEPPPEAPPAPVKPHDHLPPRQPGLWQTVVGEEGSEDAPQKLEICIDPITDVHLGVLGTDLSASKCAETVSHLPDGTWGVLAECEVGAGVKTQYSGSISGDYTQDYSMRLRAQTTGGQMSRVTTYVVTSKRIGACGAAQRPGDVVDVGNEGVKFNLFDMSGVEAPVPAAKSEAAPQPGDE